MKMYGGNFGFNKFNKKFMLSMFSVYIFFFVIFLSVAFSAFEADLVMKDITAEVKFMPEDARVSGFTATTPNNGGIASNTDYNYNRIYGDIELPNNDSSVVYEVKATNLGGAKIGISNIICSNPNLTYTLSGYEIGDLLQDENGKYTLGTTMTFYITIEHADSATAVTDLQSFNMLIEFKPFYSVTYQGVPGEEEHPKEIMEGRDLVIKTELTTTNRLRITSDTEPLVIDEHYTYDSTTHILTVNNVSGDLLISYREISYLISLFSDNSFYKESAYRTAITTIEFVDYIDTTGAEKTYDLSENKDNSIIGWVIRNADNTCNLYIGSIYDIYAKNMGKAFYKMTGLKTISFDNLNTSQSESFAYTFYDTNVTTLDLSTFNTGSATSMANMFAGMEKLETLDVSNFNTSRVTSMQSMFEGVSNLSSLDISSINFNTSSVDTMANMFANMSSLTALKLGPNFNTSNVRHMEYMFMGVSKLETLDLSIFKTGSLENTSYMFYNCDSLTTLDLTSFDTTSVEDMSYMFHSMDKLINLDISKFDTSNVISFEGMFDSCSSITSLDLTHFVTSNAIIMSNMFNKMYALKTLDISTFDLTNVSYMSYFAADCTTIQEIDMSSCDFDHVTVYSSMFSGISYNVNIIAKDDDAKTWLTNRLGGRGTVSLAESNTETTT